MWGGLDPGPPTLGVRGPAVVWRGANSTVHAPRVCSGQCWRAQGGIDKHRYFDALSTTSRHKHNLGYALMLLAALEGNLDETEGLTKTLDELVDIAA